MRERTQERHVRVYWPPYPGSPSWYIILVDHCHIHLLQSSTSSLPSSSANSRWQQGTVLPARFIQRWQKGVHIAESQCSVMTMILTLSDHSVLGQRGILWRGWRLGETPILSTWGESTDPPQCHYWSSLLTIFMAGLETWEVRLVRLWRDLRERRWAAIQLQVQTGMWHWARWCKLEVSP